MLAPFEEDGEDAAAAGVGLKAGSGVFRVRVGVGGGAVGDGVAVAGGGVGVSLAGGVNFKRSFCSVRMIESTFNPFQAISSLRLT